MLAVHFLLLLSIEMLFYLTPVYKMTVVPGVVPTVGNLLQVVVLAAGIQDYDGPKLVLRLGQKLRLQGGS